MERRQCGLRDMSIRRRLEGAWGKEAVADHLDGWRAILCTERDSENLGGCCGITMTGVVLWGLVDRQHLC